MRRVEGDNTSTTMIGAGTSIAGGGSLMPDVDSRSGPNEARTGHHLERGSAPNALTRLCLGRCP
jgi:hypothetical protein